MKTQEIIHKSLLKKSFKLENRLYKPHITLGRKVKLKNSFNYSILDEKIKDIRIDVNKIDLMRSESIMVN